MTGARVLFAVLALGLASCAQGAHVSGAGSGEAGERSVDVHGLRAQMEPAELADVSDLIVVGTVESSTVKLYSDNPLRENGPDRDPAFDDATYIEALVRIDEELMPAAPGVEDTVTVFHPGKPAEGVGVGGGHAGGRAWNHLEAGESYVLFLDEGEAMWSGGYLVNEVGDVDGDQTTLRTGEATYTLTELVEVMTQDLGDPTAPPT